MINHITRRRIMADLLGYKGKRVAVTGAASGMGQATARILTELGAEVYALGRTEVTVPVKQFIKTDLKNKASILAVSKVIPDKFYALFNCAGLPGPPFSNLDTTMVNFTGHRLLTETLLPKMQDGGAIAAISSVAGVGWQSNLEAIKRTAGHAGLRRSQSMAGGSPRYQHRLYVRQAVYHSLC
jgi:NAD(P)-dependent dehydrogenase (short-subunit alcohol dehydrogenase family)